MIFTIKYTFLWNFKIQCKKIPLWIRDPNTYKKFLICKYISSHIFQYFLFIVNGLNTYPNLCACIWPEKAFIQSWYGRKFPLIPSLYSSLVDRQYNFINSLKYWFYAYFEFICDVKNLLSSNLAKVFLFPKENIELQLDLCSSVYLIQGNKIKREKTKNYQTWNKLRPFCKKIGSIFKVTLLMWCNYLSIEEFLINCKYLSKLTRGLCFKWRSDQ